MKLTARISFLLFILGFCFFIGQQTTYAQGTGAPCPEESSFNMSIEVQNPNQTWTASINLQPCETVEVYEAHNLGSDGNLGTLLTFTYKNGSGQDLFSQTYFGFFNGMNMFPADQIEPFPWGGSVGPGGLPTTLEIRAGDQVGFGASQQYPKYEITVKKKPRREYNLGGNTFDNALVLSPPSTNYGSLRTEDQGQFFKVHLEGNQALFFSGYSEGKTNVGGGMTIDIFDHTRQDLTPTEGWLFNLSYGLKTFSKTFTNPYATPLDFYIRLRAGPWSILNFKMTLSLSPVVRVIPVIFIPGISGSKLVDTANQTELWPGVGNSHTPLTLNPDNSPSQSIVPTDAIRRETVNIPIYGPYTYEVYAPLLEVLTEPTRGGFREYQVNNDPSRRTLADCDRTQRVDEPTLFVFAYDWRKSNAESAQALKEYVRCVEQFHPDTKVDLLAHSQGGLVARRYILDNPGKVDKLITVATPWVGAPKAIYTLETGDAGFSSLLVWQRTLKPLVEFFPSVHELMPSSSYFDLGGRPFVERGDFNRNGKSNEVYNYSQLINALNRRHDPRSRPGTNNRTFHEYANATQDDWRDDQTGVKYHHIIGEQTRNNTIGQVAGRSMAVCAVGRCLSYDTFKLSMIAGDGTVPKRSSARLSSSLNLNAPNAKRWYYARFFTLQSDDQYEHTGLTQNNQVHNMILYLLERGPRPGTSEIEDEPGIETNPPATPPPTESNTSYYLNLTGVDYVAVTDSMGNTNAKIDDKFAVPVPGVSYRQLGDNSVFVAVPADQSYTFAFQNGDKPIALEVAKGAGNDASIETVKYQDLQLPAGVKAMLETSATGVANLRYDGDNDGTYETVVQPTVTLTGADAQDVTPPDVTISAELLQTGTVVTLGAQDSGSGVKTIYYSLDGLDFQPYTQPLSLNPSQTPKLHVFADDNSLNRSDLQAFTIPTKRALLVVGSASPLSSADGAVKMRLEDLGHIVTLKDAATSNSADALNQHIVVISSTGASADINTKFRDVTSPVVTWESEVFDDLGLTDTTAGTDFGIASSQTEVTIAGASHPLAAGLSGTVSVNGISGDFGWGLPGAGAHKIATLAGDANKTLVFGYESGATLSGLTAPARRVGLFMTDDTVDKFNSNGWKLFDAAVNWAGGTVNDAPSVNITQPTESQFFNPNTNINITANAADNDGSISKVDFYAGSNLLGSATASPYSFTWNNVAAGNYSLTAVATDDLGAVTTSVPVNITVNVSSGVIAGTVTQLNGTTPVGGASVRILSGATLVYSTVTNGAGEYRAEGLDPETYNLECSAEGYEPQTQNGISVVNGATTSQNFLLSFALPVIESVSPTAGAAGTTVTITGSNFSSAAANNLVNFNGTNATVSSASTTALVTVVPSGATSGRLTVATPSGTSNSLVDFFIPPSSHTGADVEVTGRMATGETRTVTTTSAGKIALILFEGISGQRVSLKVSGVALTGGNNYLDLSIKKPDGTTLIATGYISSNGTFVDVTTLPVSGSYTILVDPQDTNFGSATLSLYNVPADATASITPGGPSVTMTIATPGQNAQLNFSGASGQRVSFKVSGVSLSGGDNYVDVYLKRPDGTTMVANYYISVGGTFIDVQSLPSNGTYTILVDLHGSNTGSATITLYDVPADITTSITAGGSAVTLATTVPGQNALATFSGIAGQRVSLGLTGVTLAGGNNYLDLYLKKPDGTSLAAQSYISSGGTFIDVQNLPSTGTYTILLDPQGSNIVGATLTLYDVPADVTGLLVPGGSPLTVTIVTPGQNAAPTFEGTAGQRVSLLLSAVNAVGGNGYMDIYLNKPDGTTLASQGYVSANGCFIDVQSLPLTGTYTVLLSPQASTIGNATLTLYDVPADASGTLVIDTPAVDTATTVPGQGARLTFDGTQGQQANVSLTNNTMGQVTVNLLKPDGTILASYTSYGSSNFNLAAQTLPTTGTYTVSVDPAGVNTGGISVRITSSPIGWLDSFVDFFRSLTA